MFMNKGKPISQKLVKKMNQGKKLVPSEYEGTGQGIRICREIVHLHGGTIQIKSDNKGTVVTIDFP